MNGECTAGLAGWLARTQVGQCGMGVCSRGVGRVGGWVDKWGGAGGQAVGWASGGAGGWMGIPVLFALVRPGLAPTGCADGVTEADIGQHAPPPRPPASVAGALLGSTEDCPRATFTRCHQGLCCVPASQPRTPAVFPAPPPLSPARAIPLPCRCARPVGCCDAEPLWGLHRRAQRAQQLGGRQLQRCRGQIRRILPCRPHLPHARVRAGHAGLGEWRVGRVYQVTVGGGVEEFSAAATPQPTAPPWRAYTSPPPVPHPTHIAPPARPLLPPHCTSPHLTSPQAYDCVGEAAVQRLVHVVECMLAHCPAAVLERMRQAKASFAIVGRNQVVSGGRGRGRGMPSLPLAPSLVPGVRTPTPHTCRAAG